MSSARVASSITCFQQSEPVREHDAIADRHAESAKIPSDRVPLQQLTQAQIDLLDSVDGTPRRTEEIARKSGYSWQTARKYLPRLRDMRLVEKGPCGYYRLDV